MMTIKPLAIVLLLTILSISLPIKQIANRYQTHFRRTVKNFYKLSLHALKYSNRLILQKVCELKMPFKKVVMDRQST